MQELITILASAGDAATLVLAVGIWQIQRILKRLEALERRVLILELQRGGVENALAEKAIQGL